ncbi:RNA polymerase factor sigma-54 [Mitsuokella jalaludinii]|uniref:RNA polymerase factor sigma-54 n=1 Tax=Mitsuokella jalaludinii TaxID=187979 RepID=UPI001D031F96|nr:RNA polymerase factor sigma-54 [Mitsuokella jalaludinii]MCB5725596.1 RNA polymerase factor sigma-54 [Mitsuokella jalaludinii]
MKTIEQSLCMNLSQHLAMTMQLQQAIEILQLSAQDLCATIEKEYLENPVLEMEYSTGRRERYAQDGSVNVRALADYLDGGSKQPAYFTDEDEHQFDAPTPLHATLEEELLEQVNFTFTENESERAVATFLVGSLDSRGYLTLPTAEAARAMGCSEAEVLRILAVIQSFEPAGVGARDLAECLRLQAQRSGIYEGLVAAIIDRHLDAVAAHRLKEIAAAEHVQPADVQMAVDIVRRLNPKPGAAYGAADSTYITPDVIIRKGEKGYEVEVEEAGVPKLHISALYRQSDTFDKKTQKYIASRLRAAAWLINSIEQRRTTIRRVVEEIVRRQPAYFEKGPASLEPMTMKDVADTIGVHESTVSRAVANKYAELPTGVVALRSLFTSRSARTETGEDVAAAQAKSVIESFIKGEDPKKPLSDQKLCTLLKERGIALSRRTVMKYREQLGYDSSVKRKRY